jgi:endonuclease YncB( thermonuclease family)
MRKLLLICLLLALPASVALAGEPKIIEAKILRVHDVDTVLAEVGFKRAQSVRVAGIDGPELKHRRGRWPEQPWARQAAAWARKLLAGRKVRLIVFETDHYGRLVARVQLLDGTDYGAEAVRLGHAWAFTRYQKIPLYVDLAAYAKLRRRGLWAAPHPVRPGAWRHGAWRRVK